MLKGWLVLVLGVGMVLIALKGMISGFLPAGRGGWNLPQGQVCREDQPVLFWAMFVMDAGIGVVAIRYGIH